MEDKTLLKIGTCSWNYDSWVGLVYSKKLQHAHEYLFEYSKKYNTVEIDSWFYKVPDIEEINNYFSIVPDSFTFSCKAPQSLTQVFHFGTQEYNTNFLSPSLFTDFYNRIEPYKKQIDCIILEFEYMNKQKMASYSTFCEKLHLFFEKIPHDIPIAIECRNSNYMKKEYFDFLSESKVSHVFSEKLYMPPITELMYNFNNFLTEKIIIRLLGGDRKEIESKTKEKWNSIVDKKDLLPIVKRVKTFIDLKHPVTLNINNHYEGSAPLTILEFTNLLAGLT
jgi:uncharacterized protein YecE (DUF72 family)